MIDETKLIEKIKKRLNELEKEYTYYQRTNAEMMDIYEQGMFELENVLRWIDDLKTQNGGSRDSFPCSECSKNYTSQYEHK